MRSYQFLSAVTPCDFHHDLLAGRVNKIRQDLNENPRLATDNWKFPPVFSVLHHSCTHQNAPLELDLLKKYKADFKAEYYVDTWFKLNINMKLNPIAYLLLNGGDSRLMKKLIECGADINHPSVAKIIKIIKDHNTDQALNYSTPYKSNSYDRSPVQLVTLVDNKAAKNTIKNDNILLEDKHDHTPAIGGPGTRGA